VQWGVQKGETCDDIARALYGSPRYAPLLQRYNHVACKAGAPLREGLTLVVPETPTTLPDARLRSMNPDVRARPGSGGWAPAASGMPLFSNYNVNTLDQGRADVEFIDRTRVFLAPNTLVVIYGTASQTRVSKTAPAAVEVESGEIKAGLSALREGGADGDATVAVAIKGGGRINAASRDTVVQRKGDRTTVAVFDGKAGVTSGGKSVEVPRNFGTRFVGVAPPAPPRPLPPAPLWLGGGSGTTVLVSGDAGTAGATWAPVPGAIAYRVELEQEKNGERRLVRRDEVPSSINAFRGEKLELATYYLTVRAIDKEEYLGIASEPRVIRLLRAQLDGESGEVSPDEVKANPYGVLTLRPEPQLEMALDDGPFGPMPATIDLRRTAPHALRLRRQGSTIVDTIPVHYSEVGATVAASAAADGASLALRVELRGFKGVNVEERVRPSARVRLPDGVRTVALVAGPDGALTGSVPLTGAVADVRIDVVDDRGSVLGTTSFAPTPAPAAPPAAPAPQVRYRQIGAYTPLWQPSPAADVLPFAPTPLDGAAASVGMVHGPAGWTFQGQVRGSGAIGRLGLEAALRSDTNDDQTADAAGWLGARWRLIRLEGAVLELAPALRVGFPASASGMPAQLEPAVAVGGVAGRFTWLVDTGGRVRLGPDNSVTGVPTGQAFVLAGGTLDVLSWLRVNAALDAHVVMRDSAARGAFLGGLGAGLETGGVVYGGLSLHVSPWRDPGVGPFAAQLAVGFRGGP